MTRRGFTLVEVLVGTAVLVGAGGALLAGMNSAMVHASYLEQMQMTMGVAEARLAQLATEDFDRLLTDPQYANARMLAPPAPPAFPAGLCEGLNEDTDWQVPCNGGPPDLGEDWNPINGLLDEPIPRAHLTIQIRPNDPVSPTAPSILDLHIAVCWPLYGRVIGEDQDLDGVLENPNQDGINEDANNNGWMDSPVMISTRIARTD